MQSLSICELQHRNLFPEWLNANEMDGVGVEVGVFEGDYSWALSQKWRGNLIGIDPFRNFPDEEYRDGCNRVSMDQIKEKVVKRFCRVLNYELREMTSLEAVLLYTDKSLTFVYIDANHRYESVKEDIAAWWPKVRHGGVLCGHDMYRRDDDGQLADVQRAVLEFAYLTQLPVWVTPCSSWWVVKP